MATAAKRRQALSGLEMDGFVNNTELLFHCWLIVLCIGILIFMAMMWARTGYGLITVFALSFPVYGYVRSGWPLAVFLFFCFLPAVIAGSYAAWKGKVY